MNFDFSPDQKSLQAHARRFLSDNCNCAGLRRSLDDGSDAATGLWHQLTELGWHAISIPEDAGGVGLGALEVCVLMEEMGRALMPAPFFSTVCLGVELLKAVDSTASAALLQQVAGGQSLCVDGVGPEALVAEQIGLRVRQGKLFGRVENVRDLALADVLLAPALTEAGEWSLVQVDLQNDAVARVGQRSMDALVSFGWAQFEGVPVTVLAEGAHVQQLLSHVADLAATYQAFEQIGGADAACALAKDYALTRYAFGRPIGSNQAIKHKLADMVVRIELARSNAYYAAWAVANDAPDASVAAATARISACDAYEFAAEECLQVHGGIGYTWEADCHFYYKRARLLSVSLGGPAIWSQRLLNTLAARHD